MAAFWGVRDPRIEALRETAAGVLVVAPRPVVNSLGNIMRQSRRTMRPDAVAGAAAGAPAYRLVWLSPVSSQHFQPAQGLPALLPEPPAKTELSGP